MVEQDRIHKLAGNGNQGQENRHGGPEAQGE